MIYSLEQLSARVKQLFTDYHLKQEPANLYKPIGYALGAGGKRIRPTLLFAACNLFTDDIGNADDAALAIEIFHNFTLLHDDLMDNADLRRGNPTVHTRWNANVAILSGDAMTILAYYHIARVPEKFRSDVLDVFNRVALGVCEGQQYDMDFEQLRQVDSTSYLRMIELKTAVLLQGALQIGAIIGNASSHDIKRIGEFGRYMGLAFQLQDDLLDAFGSTGSFGKSVGGDIIACKKTILPVETIKLLDDKDKDSFLSLYNSRDIDPQKKIAHVLEYYQRVGVERIVSNLIDDFYSRSAEALDTISVEFDRKQPLRDILNSLVDRQA